MKLPTLVPIEGSSNIHSIGHSGSSLFVRFLRKDGTVLYRFNGVTEKDYQAILKADSVGKHFHRHIRVHFPGVKIEEK